MKDEPSAFQAALCGSIAGAIAGFITCPLDVLKTRMMLAKPGPGETEAGLAATMQQIVRQEGAGASAHSQFLELVFAAWTDWNACDFGNLNWASVAAFACVCPVVLFGGVGARVVWMSLWGLIFLGCYEKAKLSLIDIVWRAAGGAHAFFTIIAPWTALHNHALLLNWDCRKAGRGWSHGVLINYATYRRRI
jgi:hypothetical protein